jgi:chromosome segregation ATPase
MSYEYDSHLLVIFGHHVQLRNVQLELEEARSSVASNKSATVGNLSTELQAKKRIVINLRSELDSVRKDLLKTEEMLKKKNTDNKTGAIVENLRKELKVAKAQSALLEERLDSSKLSNWNSLVEVATNREQVRNLKEDLEEVLEEKINGDHQEIIDVDDGKRDMDDEVEDSPRKRQKTRTNDDDEDSDVVVDDDDDEGDDDSDDEDDDDIVL